MLALYVEGTETINEKVEYFSDISSYIVAKKDLEVYLRMSYEEYHHRTRNCNANIDYCKLYEENLCLVQNLDKDVLQLHYSASIRNNGTQVYLNLVRNEDLDVFQTYLWPILIPNQQSPRIRYTKFSLTKIRLYNSNFIYMKPEFIKEYTTGELVEVLKRYLSDGSKKKDVKIRMFIVRMCNFIKDENQLAEICQQLGLDEFKEEALRCLQVCKELINEKVDLNLSELRLPQETSQILNNDASLQQIFYGAPGTGKSHEIKEKTKGQKVVRTTFHPDSDYSSFVGAYKPTMEDVDTQVVPVVVKSGISLEPQGIYKEKRISYKFVIQAFLKAYLGAWKLYSENPDSPAPQFLVIEEINRGNCAQIFGDLFQLLDRNERGFSEYPIEADSDLTDAINIAFTNEKSDYKLEKVIDVEGVIKNYISNYGFTLSKDIQEGRVLLLPPNLFIWATMNTSDQSLFPIDSAFKRRWDWQYIKIAEGKQKDSVTPLGWKILVEDEEQDRVRLYDWWKFLQLINTKIFGATDSADKQMGYFFAKATESFSGNKLGVIKKDGVFVEEASKSPISCDFITAETFVNKVLFYLWTDVLKDNEYDEITNLMKDGDKDLSFPDFFGETGKEISPEALRVFLNNVMKGVKEEEEEWCEVAEWNIVSPQTNNNTNSSTNTNSGFKPNSVIFKITDNIQDSDLLYERARKSWRMAKWRAEKTEYFYAYVTPLKIIKACYKVNGSETEERDGKIRYQFNGEPVEDPMVEQPVEAISHSRGQVVFYPDNWGGVQTDDNNDK